MPHLAAPEEMPQDGSARSPADNVGILAAEVYFPQSYVRQEDLEEHDGVPAGKYTAGLGQQGVAFVGDREDTVSMSLTVLRQLLERHGVLPSEIGRLEVGTETAVDSSKSIKSYLMMLFEEAGNTDVEGVDCIQACYGGTAAVQNAANWIESRAWDGRLAVVVMSDISLYEAGPARPTSGAGAVALLIGPNAPLVLERGLSATHMQHAYDFYKPSGLFPRVDGPLSVFCYLHTLDLLYQRYSQKFEKLKGRPFSMEEVDHALFHAPYNKLVQKAHARLAYLDMCRKGCPWDGLSLPPGTSLDDGSHPRPPASMPPELDRALVAACFPTYDRKVRPSTCVSRQCGNMYAASIWSGVAQLIETMGPTLEGRRIMMYSYGSGISASMFSLVGRAVEGKYNLAHLQSMSDLAMRLARRLAKPPEEFDQAIQLAQQRYGAGKYKPEWPPVSELEKGSYYLLEVDARYRRFYTRKE